MSQAAVTELERRDSWLVGAWYGLGVLVLATVIGSVNRQIILLVTEPFKQSMGLSDTQIGLLNGFALTLVAAIATYPMGWLADRVDRRVLLAVCVVVWSLSTVAFGLAQTFPLLFVFGMGIAVGEAILGPITYSMIPDLFPRDKWLVANYVFFVAALLGASVGVSASGALIGFIEANKDALPAALASLETWRSALILSTIAGPALAVAVLLIPLRKRIVDAAASSSGKLIAYFKTHARSLCGVFLGFGICYAASYTMSGWLAPALQRVFGETPQRMGLILGATSAVAALAGVGGSYILVRVLRKRFGDTAPMRAAQIAIALALATTCFLPLAASATQVYALSALKTGFVTAAMCLSPAILQFIAPAQMRGRVIALGGLVSIVFGALAPLMVGIVSDNVFSRPEQLFWSIAAVSAPCLLAGLLLMLYGTKTLPDTIRAASEQS